MVQCSRSSWSKTLSDFAATPEAAHAASARFELVDDLECRVNHWHDDELSDPIERVDGVGSAAAVPTAHHQRALIIGIDESDEIAQHDSMSMSETRSRQ